MLNTLCSRKLQLTTLVVAAFSGACSNLTPNECLYADWYAKGEEAAYAGQPVTTFMVHQQDCNKHGINPDRWDFVLGWEDAHQGESS